MGKGDKRSRKGKIWRGSFGNTRRQKSGVPAFVPKPKAKKAAPPTVEETLFELPAVEGGEVKVAKPKKAAAPKKPKVEGEEKKATVKKEPKKKPATAEAAPESATEEKKAE